MSIKFLVLGGGEGYFGFWGGGSADFIFVGARIFLIQDKGPGGLGIRSKSGPNEGFGGLKG